MEKDTSIPDFCDMCGCDLDSCNYDYKVVIEVMSGKMRKDPAEMCDGDPGEEIRDLLEKASKHSQAELMDGVYRKMVFTICPACQKEYIQNPIVRNFNRHKDMNDEQS